MTSMVMGDILNAVYSKVISIDISAPKNFILRQITTIISSDIIENSYSVDEFAFLLGTVCNAK